MNAQVTPIHALTPRSLAEACAALEGAKQVEAEATARRLAAENQVLAFIGQLPAEGTTRSEDAGYIAVIQTSVRRSVDADKLADIAPAIPEAIGKRLIRWKPELVTRELRYVQDNEPEIYALVAQAIEAKPAKPHVKIERVAPEVA